MSKQGVQILGITETGDKAIGWLVWDGKTIQAQPDDSPLLRGILTDSIIASGGQARVIAADGLAFLEALRFHYRGAYLRATPVMEMPVVKPTLALVPGDVALAELLEMFRSLTGREPSPTEIEEVRVELERQAAERGGEVIW